MRLNDFPMFAMLFFAVFVVAIGLLGTVNFTADTTAAASVDHPVMEEGQEGGIEVNNGSILAAIAAVLSIGVLVVAGLRNKGL